MYNKYFYFIIVLIFLNLMACSNDQEQKIKEEIKLNDDHIKFYGKVVNSDGAPLKGAKIIAEYFHSSNIPPWYKGESKTETQTDEEGLFTIEGIVGQSLTISDIQLKEYWRGKKNKFFFGSYNYSKKDLTRFVSDKNKPVIFELQKIIYDSYILERDTIKSLIIEQGANENFFIEFLSGYNTNKEPEFYDLKMECAYIDGKFTLQFLKKNDNDKVVVSDNEKLNKEDFDKSEHTNKIEIIKTPNSKKNEDHFKYLYIKSKENLYYTKLNFNITLKTTRSYIAYNSLINPYGEFQFEGYPQSLLRTGWFSKIENEHYHALDQGKLANKTDFKKLLGQMLEEPNK